MKNAYFFHTEPLSPQQVSELEALLMKLEILTCRQWPLTLLKSCCSRVDRF